MNGRIVVGANQVNKWLGKESTHAEMQMLTKILNRNHIYNLKKPSNIGKKYKLVTVIRNKNGSYNGSSKPCLCCQYFLHIHNFKRIQYIDIIDGKPYICTMRRNKNAVLDKKYASPHCNNIKDI